MDKKEKQGLEDYIEAVTSTGCCMVSTCADYACCAGAAVR